MIAQKTVAFVQCNVCGDSGPDRDSDESASRAVERLGWRVDRFGDLAVCKTCADAFQVSDLTEADCEFASADGVVKLNALLRA